MHSVLPVAPRMRQMTQFYEYIITKGDIPPDEKPNFYHHMNVPFEFSFGAAVYHEARRLDVSEGIVHSKSLTYYSQTRPLRVGDKIVVVAHPEVFELFLFQDGFEEALKRFKSNQLWMQRVFEPLFTDTDNSINGLQADIMGLQQTLKQLADQHNRMVDWMQQNTPTQRVYVNV